MFILVNATANAFTAFIHLGLITIQVNYSVGSMHIYIVQKYYSLKIPEKMYHNIHNNNKQHNRFHH